MQNTTFFGLYPHSNIIVLESVASTNDYLKLLLSKFTPQHSFTAIMAREQTQGRGQRGSTWQSIKSKNLTASFAYSPNFLRIDEQFKLTIISSLSLYDIVQQLQPHKVSIKWPNDIYVNNKKIAGILIENKIAGSTIKHAIIGIGLNIYQTEFSEEIKNKTTSISLENFETNVTILDIVRRLQQRLHYYASRLEQGHIDSLLKSYNDRLYRRDEWADYFVGKEKIKGKIKVVEMDGLLQVDVNKEIRKFDLKEISFCI